MSNFPRGTSGVGLVLLRFAASALLVTIAMDNLCRGDASVLSVLLIVLALFLTLGLFTVIAAIVGALLTVALSFLPHHEALAASAITVLVSVALALLGGGAYSFDARLFGPRRLVWPNTGM